MCTRVAGTEQKTSVADPHWFKSGSGYGSRSKFLITKNWEIFLKSWNKIYIFFLIKNCNLSKLLYKRSHHSSKKTSRTAKLEFSSLLWVIFALLDPDPDPHMQHCKKPWKMSICTFFIPPKKTDCWYVVCVFMEPDPDPREKNMGKKRKKGKKFMIF